ncbi:MAG: domain S-box/diguanylate cyclase protein [Acidimicrobiales bacterium]|nr:domain S-box/diguanylate cyclase protein [Acidimicrobiales bacterium]
MGAELAAHGHEVDWAPTVADGLARARSWQPELAVIDGDLPDGHWVDVLSALKSSTEPGLDNIRVLVVASDARRTERYLAAVEGALDFVVKPVQPVELARRVERCLTLGSAFEVRGEIQRRALRALAAGNGTAADPFAVAARTAPMLAGLLLRSTVSDLTPSDKFVIAVLGETDSLDDAAGRLGVLVPTLTDQLRAISRHLGLGTPEMLTILARRNEVLNADSEAIFAMDADGRCLFANRRAAELVGYGRGELVGHLVHPLLHHSRRDGIPVPVEECAIHRAMLRQETLTVTDDVFWHANGAPVWVSYTVAPARETDGPLGALITVHDATDRVEAAARRHRRGDRLNLALDAAAAVAFEVKLAEGTVAYSENAGYLFGGVPGETSAHWNDVLAIVHPDDRDALALEHRRALRSGALVDDEFRLLLPSGERRVRSRARVVPDALGDATLLGVAVDITDHVEAPDREKRGRALSWLGSGGDPRRPPKNDELRLHYQPVIDLRDGGVSGVEALVRWERPDVGLVAPADFIPDAEEIGTIVPIGAWVLTTACQQLATWDATGPPGLDLAVNLSGRQLLEPDLVDVVADALAESGITPGRLCLEVTESLLMVDTALTALHRLHALGVQLAIDDFGTGYSSLLYLRQFPVTVLKLDRTFVAGLGRHSEDEAIVQASIGLAHALGLQASAEGVEDAGQLAVLVEMGCDLAQGYHWSPPAPADHLAELLRSAPWRSRSV